MLGFACTLQGHAGTVPMAMRYDPVPAVGEAAVEIERRCGGVPERIGREDVPPSDQVHHLVCTIGSVVLWPGASNVIAGSANFSIDIR
jgi:allantoate deiminase